MSIWDEDYRQTTRMKKGAAAMPPMLGQLAEWIAGYFAVPVPLNIIYDRNEPIHGPRLQVIFEREHDADGFRVNGAINYDPVKQAAVKAQYLRLLPDGALDAVDAEKLFVIFDSFEPAARREANGRMTVEHIRAVERLLESSSIWKIRPGFGTAVVFFHTEAQRRMAEGTEFRQRCRDVYMAFLLPFDEFGYFKETPIDLIFDSRENFDKAYQGSWFAYDR